MKKLFILLLIILVRKTNFKAQIEIQDLLSIKPQFVNPIDGDAQFANQTFMHMNFDSSSFERDYKNLNQLQVIRIVLYYSDYQESGSFSQPKLNKMRFESLFKVCPSFKEKPIKFLVRAQKVKDREAAKNCFHGFLVEYIKRETKKERAEKTAAMLTKLKSLKADSCVQVDDSSRTVLNRKVKRHKEFVPNGRYKPNFMGWNKLGLTFKKESMWERKPIMKPQITRTETSVSSFAKKEECHVSKKKYEAWRKKYSVSKRMTPSRYGGFYSQTKKEHNLIEQVFKRNVWKNQVVVTDVTGSMYHYITQLMAWHKLNLKSGDVKASYFFNDGDFKRLKPVGNTGGIYLEEDSKYAKVEDKLSFTMLRGGGGDAPENDIEALIEAQEKYGVKGNYILIADNFANMRDYGLIEKLRYPVHVILCGSWYGINTQYLDLARKTSGSVHTMEEDLKELAILQEGQIIEIAKNKYRLKNGKFIKVFGS